MSDSHTQTRPDTVLGDAFYKAVRVAGELHANQGRKGTSAPYMSHLLQVAAIVLEYGGTETQAVAAMLHDAVEDQGGRETLAMIRDTFGDEVARMVAACSDHLGDPSPPWHERKACYVNGVPDEQADALLVSAADKFCNVSSILRDYRTLGEALWDRFAGGRDGTLWYYRALVDAYRISSIAGSQLVTDLDRAVTDLEQAVAP